MNKIVYASPDIEVRRVMITQVLCMSSVVLEAADDRQDYELGFEL